MRFERRLLVVILLLLMGVPGIIASETIPAVHIVEIAAPIGPGVADFVKDALATADRENAACVVIQLDTPGGLAESMRHIIVAILAARTPVVVYVAPSGARAASAGVMITMAADIAAKLEESGAVKESASDDLTICPPPSPNEPSMVIRLKVWAEAADSIMKARPSASHMKAATALRGAAGS